MISAGVDGRILATDIEMGSSVLCESHDGPVHSVAIDNSNPNVVYSASGDKTVRRWDRRAGPTADVLVSAAFERRRRVRQGGSHLLRLRVLWGGVRSVCQLESRSRFTSVLTHPYKDILVTGASSLDACHRGAYVFDLKRLPWRYSSFVHAYNFSDVPCYVSSRGEDTGISGLAMNAEGEQLFECSICC